MRVLLTEDDPVLAGVLADFLREEGHLVTCVDMRQAGCLAHWTGWDACILDPGGDSFFELRPSEAAELRHLAAHLPVVVTTGLLAQLGRYETEGVVAHLIAAIGAGDLHRARTLETFHATLGLIEALLQAAVGQLHHDELGQILETLARQA